MPGRRAPSSRRSLRRRVCPPLVAVLAATVGLSVRGGAAMAEADDSLPAAALSARLDSLAREVRAGRGLALRISGYLQARWETSESKSDTVAVAGAPPVVRPANDERFGIRLARLKIASEAGALSRGVVLVDAGRTGAVRLLEAYVTLLDPWTPDRRHALTVGQMSVPFGYEIERSSRDRELPERSLAARTLFPGQRDRGIRLVSRWTPRLETTVGAFNGGGLQDPDFPAADPTRRKDLLARARWTGGVVEGGASYYHGAGLVPLTGPDLEVDRARLGIDAAVSWRRGERRGRLWGEFYSGRSLNPDSLAALVGLFPTTAPRDPARDARLLVPGADPAHLATPFIGGYVMWAQDLGGRLGAAARYDVFDPDTDADHDRFERIGLGLDYRPDAATRVSVAYEIPRTERRRPDGGFADPKDNLWTVQFQLAF